MELVSLQPRILILTVLIFCGQIFNSPCQEVDSLNGWGIEGLISTEHVREFSPAEYLQLLKTSDVRWVRERSFGGIDPESSIPYDTNIRRIWREQKSKGFDVVAFYSTFSELPTHHPWDKTSVDLLKLYEEATIVGEFVTEPSAWETFNEPDAFFLSDPPDRAAAAQKAIYLGLIDGAKRRNAEPIVLMGGLAHAPTPWLRRAAENGYFEYTDGLNIHFYGHARDFQNFVRVHRAFASSVVKDRTLPIWITECGMDAVPVGDPRNAAARKLQEEFTLETAQVAIDEGVAVFMPFMFIAQNGGGHEMVTSPTDTFPAWDAYRDFTKTRKLENPPFAARPRNPNRLILQWLPDYSTCTPHKVGGIYWSDYGNSRVSGKVIIYNLSPESVKGQFEVSSAKPIASSLVGDHKSGEVIEIERNGQVSIPVEFDVPESEYFESAVAVAFRPTNSESSSHQKSTATFEIGSRPTSQVLPKRYAIHGVFPMIEGNVDYEPLWPDYPNKVTSESAPWVGLNGIKIEPIAASATQSTSLDAGWLFSFTPDRELAAQKTAPPVAITKVDGLPAVKNGFLRIRTEPDFGGRGSFRVDLVDQDGQRFTIAENFGKNRFNPTPGELLLSYEDLHLYAWGRVINPMQFDPSQIREIQLRFHLMPGARPMQVKIDVVGSED